ncbi:MAG: 50S ribosomal protein L9 [Eubacteriaceae bacterium]
MMKVVLLENVKNIGNKGDIVEVKDGYGRNFLIKNKKGLMGTPENIEMAMKAKEEEAKRLEEEKQAALNLAKEIDAIEITVVERAGEDGKLFGSVTSKDIAEALEAQKSIKVDKRKIELETPIRNVGRIEVKVKTYQGVVGNLTVLVKGEEQ